MLLCPCNTAVLGRCRKQCEALLERSLCEGGQMVEENGGGWERFGWKPVGGGKRKPQGEL